MADIYIAHAPEDLEKIRRLVEAFDGRGYDVWVDALTGVGPGSSESRGHLREATIAVIAWSPAAARSRGLRRAARRALAAPLGDGGLPGLELAPGSSEQSKYFPIWLSTRRALPPDLRRAEALKVEDLADQSKELLDVVEAVRGLIGPPRARQARTTTEGVPATLELAAARWRAIRDSRRPRDFGRYLADFGEHEPVFSELAAERFRRLRSYGRALYALRRALIWAVPLALAGAASLAAAIYFAPELRARGCAALANGAAADGFAASVESALGCDLAAQIAEADARRENATRARDAAVERRDAAERALAEARREAQAATAEIARLAEDSAAQAARIAELTRRLEETPPPDPAALEEAAETRSRLAAAEARLETLRAQSLEALRRLRAAYDDDIEALPPKGFLSGAVSAEALQQCLTEAGAPLPDHGVDGKLGPETHAALAAALEQARDPDAFAALLACLSETG